MRKDELEILVKKLASVHEQFLSISGCTRLWRLSPSYGSDVERIRGCVSKARRFTEQIIERAENQISAIKEEEQREQDRKRAEELQRK